MSFPHQTHAGGCRVESKSRRSREAAREAKEAEAHFRGGDGDFHHLLLLFFIPVGEVSEGNIGGSLAPPSCTTFPSSCAPPTEAAKRRCQVGTGAQTAGLALALLGLWTAKAPAAGVAAPQTLLKSPKPKQSAASAFTRPAPSSRRHSVSFRGEKHVTAPMHGPSPSPASAAAAATATAIQTREGLPAA